MERRGVVERHPLQERHQPYEGIYPMADVFVMPSWAEGCGFTNVEALSFDLLVISSRLGSIGEVINHGVMGFFVPLGDVSAVSLAMERFQAGVGRVYQEGLET